MKSLLTAIAISFPTRLSNKIEGKTAAPDQQLTKHTAIYLRRWLAASQNDLIQYKLKNSIKWSS